MQNTTPYEKQLENFEELKENIIDRIEGLMMLVKDMTTAPTIVFRDYGFAINNLALISADDSTLAPQLTFNPLEGDLQIAFAKVILDNIEELFELARDYSDMRTNIAEFANITLSKDNPETQKLKLEIEDYIRDLRADVPRKDIWLVGDDKFIKMINPDAMRRRDFNVNIGIFQVADKDVEDAMPEQVISVSKEDIVARIAYEIDQERIKNSFYTS